MIAMSTMFGVTLLPHKELSAEEMKTLLPDDLNDCNEHDVWGNVSSSQRIVCRRDEHFAPDDLNDCNEHDVWGNVCSS